jgi:fructose-specific PTS system IIA-like component
VAGASAERWRGVRAAACKCVDAHSVEALLAKASWSADAAPVQVLERELIHVGSDAITKEEAIKEAVDLLFIAGRTEDPREVEEAVWAREQTYSTGLGYGFAVPHCKSTTVAAPALAVLKLDTGIDWGSMDGEPVRVVLLLTVPASDTSGAHMKVFAKLARKLMHEEFRERLMAAPDAEGIEGILREELWLK